MAQRATSAFGPTAHFYECPRWRAGRWWVSDMRGEAVYSFSAEGEARVEIEMARPAGLGWLPDGKLLVVSMDARLVLQVSPTGQVEKTIDLGPLFGETKGFLNDMAVTKAGHAYVGFDADFHAYGPDADLGMVVHLPPDGRPGVVAEGLAFPNGMVLTPDESTLVVAETMQPRLAGFAIGRDGGLTARGPWGVLAPKRDGRPAGGPPLGDKRVQLDGCAMDAEGFVWAADVNTGCLRIAPGGEIVDAIVLPDGLRTFACGLGGPDGRTLMICGADDNFADRTSRREAQLFTAQVEVAAP